MRFEHEFLAQRNRPGSGAAAERLSDDTTRLAASRVMVICSPREVARAEQITVNVPVACSICVTPRHAAVLPHALAFNAPFAPGAEERLARAFGAPDAAWAGATPQQG
ncbi:hypothetical protein GORHZ_174_00050 [Gordonia rhizosphera NBRC 16068]|uniref:Uncharacterized protein n=1 Tax=Gordonia rhizosphera NBRC 16068 TaxID=1108045 RepID=K6X0T3_9ACTN|nr:hypothetical protein GORHZ_174_00050 [Gordonia rhizosphera NBRC 16068]